MKSVFDDAVRQELIDRIHLLHPGSMARWGKMTVAQMVKHCALCEDYYFGNVPVKRSFMGRLFGKAALSSILKNETSGLRQNAPTPVPFKVNEPVNDLEEQKKKWTELIKRYGKYNASGFTHWFFGYMSRQELGQFIYKHSDHHLKQFGV